MHEQTLREKITKRAKEEMERLKDLSQAMTRLEKAGFRDKDLRLRIERQRAKLKALIGDLV